MISQCGCCLLLFHNSSFERALFIPTSKVNNLLNEDAGHKVPQPLGLKLEQDCRKNLSFLSFHEISP